jgi:hypothetical protein
MRKRCGSGGFRAPTILALTAMVAGLVLLPRAAGAAAGTGAAGGAAAGRQLWASRHQGLGNSMDAAYDVAVGPDGSMVFVTGAGTVTAVEESDFVTVAYDAATGTQVWSADYAGTGGFNDFAESIAVAPDGSVVFVTGSSFGSGTLSDYATVAYDAHTGAQLWVSRYDGPASGDDVAYSLAVDPDGSAVFVTGGSQGLADGFDYTTVAYTAATGALLWTARYDGPTHLYDVARSLAVSGDGTRILVTGESDVSATDSDYATVSYDAATGAQRWAARYGGALHSFDEPWSVAASADGAAAVVTGYSASSQGDDYATVAYDQDTGGTLWVRRYDGPAHSVDHALDVAVSPDAQETIVTGSSTGVGTSDDIATIAYDGSGHRMWIRRFVAPGRSSDEGFALALSPDASTAYVAGTTDGSYATIAYEAGTGAVLWGRRYGGTGNSDGAYAVTTAPDGSAVFVTGQSYTPGSGTDYATVAYSTS